MERFHYKWATTVNQSRNFEDLRPIVLLLCELVHWKDGDTYLGHPYVLEVQDELFSRGLIPFKLENYSDLQARVDDLNKLDELKRDIISYIALSFQREFTGNIFLNTNKYCLNDEVFVP